MELPLDLFELFINHIPHDDVATLKSCCLVHTWWIPACRRRLFNSVTFHELFDLEVWADSFPSALHSPAEYVQTLAMSGVWASLVDEDFNPEEFDESLLKHFRSFDQVRKLVFTALDLVHAPSSPEIHFSHFRTSLTSLEFYSPFPTTPTQLLHFICSFPHLDNLTISGANRWLEEKKEDYMDLQTSPLFGGKLRLLECSDPSGAFVTRLVDVPKGLRFRSIELDFYRLEDYRPIGRLITSCASTLEVLQLGSLFAGMLSCSTHKPPFSNTNSRSQSLLRRFRPETKSCSSRV